RGMDERVEAAVDLVIAGERMRLLAERALYWPARNRLLIADLHLGKGDILRSAGIPVPSGGTRHDLSRLGALLEATGAHQIWILGDFLRGAPQPRVEAAWRRFLAAHPGCSASVIAGNHDGALRGATRAHQSWIRREFLRGAPEPRVEAAWRRARAAPPGCSASVIAGNHDRALVPDAAGLVHLPDDVRDGPFRFRHLPVEGPGGAQVAAPPTRPDGHEHVICGHLHPVVRLPGLRSEEHTSEL